MSGFAQKVEFARVELDRHIREIVAWHFSEKTGSPYWLDYARSHKLKPVSDIGGFDDLMRMSPFNDEALRHEQPQRFIPKAYVGRPYFVFETGGTTGMPKQRVGFEDHRLDYEAFSATLDDSAFPKGGDWLMLGPTGPRRLRLSIEHLAQFRGGCCYHVDLDPRWVKKLIARGARDEGERYLQHAIDQALVILKHRKISCLFTTPRLLEALGEKISLARAGIKGVFCGGTSMTRQAVRFMVEEVLEGKVRFVPTYGNTLMGLACSLRPGKKNDYSLQYYAPQPRAILRVVNPASPDEVVGYGEWGRVELTTLTKEFFMPRLLERDEVLRLKPVPEFPWDGVADVRPFTGSGSAVVEGVY